MSGPNMFDRVKETSTSTGTGTFSLAGAVSGYRAFSSVFSNNDLAYYTIWNQDVAGEWEVGIGTWTTGNNLARTTILASSNSGSAVNFSAGTKQVFVTIPAAVVGGQATKKGAFASRPAAGQPGLLYLPTDAPLLSRDDGSAWASWGPICPLTEPVPANFSWVNQGTATEDDTTGGISLTAAQTAGFNLRLKSMAVPSKPYSITALIAASGPNANDWGAGLFFRDSVGGGIHSFEIGFSGTPNFASYKWTNLTTFNAAFKVDRPYVFQGMSAPWLWLRIADDTSNRTCFYSVDGINWTIFDQQITNTFITPDTIGFMIYNHSITSDNPHMRLLSWKQG